MFRRWLAARQNRRQAGFQQLAKGSAAYEEVRRLIGPLVEPALLMQRVLVK